MNMQEWIEKAVAQKRQASFSESPQLTLGVLIEEVERAGIKKEDGEEKDVQYDFGTAIPTTLDSWRGAYDELALGYKLTGYDNHEEHMSEIRAGAFLAELKSALGKPFTGWKGGDYTMTEKTPVWVANPGDAGNTGIISVLDDGWRLVILTGFCNY